MSGGIGLTSPRAPSTGFGQSYSGAVSPGDIASETIPRWGVSAASSFAAGTLHLTRIHLVPGAYTTVTLAVGTQGVTLTNSYFGLYTASNATAANNTQLATSLDVSTALAAVAAGARYSGTLNYTVTTEADYFIGFLVGSAGTGVQFYRGSQGALNPTVLNDLAPRLAIRSAASGLTALPDPVGTVNDAAAAPLWWIRYA